MKNQLKLKVKFDSIVVEYEDTVTYQKHSTKIMEILAEMVKHVKELRR